jgi:hypothetical protein
MLAGSPIAGAPIAGSFGGFSFPSSPQSNVGTAWLDLMLSEYWTASTIDAYLVADGTAFDPTVDLYLDDIPVLDRISTTTVTGKSHLDGVFTADNVELPLGIGDVAQWFVIVRVDGTEATSPVVVATDAMANDIPINSIVGAGDVLEFNLQTLGLGRI